jgi:hypothetical protein
MKNWFKELSTVEKIGFLGSLASIVGLGLVFLPPSSSSQETYNSPVTSGSQSPAIGSNQGSVTINYGAESTEKRYVLRNPQAGAVLIIDKPSLDAVAEPNRHVCTAPAGTPIVLTGRSAKLGALDMWREVKIIGGECSERIGWAALENISIE